MSGVIGFMNGSWGRVIRIVVGLALIGYGLLILGSTVGLIVALVGLVALVMGIWGRCLLGLVSHPRHGAV